MSRPLNKNGKRPKASKLTSVRQNADNDPINVFLENFKGNETYVNPFELMLDEFNDCVMPNATNLQTSTLSDSGFNESFISGQSTIDQTKHNFEQHLTKPEDYDFSHGPVKISNDPGPSENEIIEFTSNIRKARKERNKYKRNNTQDAPKTSEIEDVRSSGYKIYDNKSSSEYSNINFNFESNSYDIHDASGLDDEIIFPQEHIPVVASLHQGIEILQSFEGNYTQLIEQFDNVIGEIQNNNQTTTVLSSQTCTMPQSHHKHISTINSGTPECVTVFAKNINTGKVQTVDFVSESEIYDTCNLTQLQDGEYLRQWKIDENSELKSLFKVSNNNLNNVRHVEHHRPHLGFAFHSKHKVDKDGDMSLDYWKSWLKC